MGVIKKTLIVEDIFEVLFAMLPLFAEDNVDYHPVFKAGNDKDLLEDISKREDQPYPLIWLMYPFNEDHKRTHVSLSNVTFVLAVKSSLRDRFNDERLDNTFKNYLMPLVDNIKHLFKYSNVIEYTEELQIIKYPNYGVENKNIVTARWDAIRIQIDNLVIKDRCIKQVTF